MKQLIIEELPYQLDSAPIFASILDMEQPVYLDSSRPYSTRGRFDIFSADPITSISSDQGAADYFAALREAMHEFIPEINNDYHLPFIGGAIGYLGYDLGLDLEKLPSQQTKTLRLPDAVMGLYSWAVIVDHALQRCSLIAHPCTDRKHLDDVRARLTSASNNTQSQFTLGPGFSPTSSYQDYKQAFDLIQDYIHAGDCYQINLTQLFSATFSGSSWPAYLAMRQAAAAPYSAYMRYRGSDMLSMSPERFLHISNQRVTTSPIKGTMKRSTDPKVDAELAQQLLNSSKDRAENLMIVDLLRNDLGKSCLPGSIQVDELFKLESFETVHHLVSTISGQLNADNDSMSLLSGCFPGGSITGTPKVRAMEIIDELENYRRGVYCGSMGYLSCDDQMDFNIAIRTMVCEDERIYCGAGGAIVADSECDSEYQECFTKVEKLITALPGADHTSLNPSY